MKSVFERTIGQTIEKVRLLMGEAGNNRALRLSDLKPKGEIWKLLTGGSSASGGGTGGGGGAGPATTDGLAEGNRNLYYTDQRAAAAAPVRSVAGQQGDVTAAELASAMKLGSAAGASVDDFATAGQGQRAETALQDPPDMLPGVPMVRMENDWARLEVGEGLELVPTEGTSDDGGSIKLHITAAGGVPYHVPDGTTYRVPAGMQALFTNPIDLGEDASIELDGALVEVS